MKEKSQKSCYTNAETGHDGLSKVEHFTPEERGVETHWGKRESKTYREELEVNVAVSGRERGIEGPLMLTRKETSVCVFDGATVVGAKWLMGTNQGYMRGSR